MMLAIAPDLIRTVGEVSLTTLQLLDNLLQILETNQKSIT